ncbi:MAG: zf-HC2 domain-containing protein [Candidatus Bipolaricaulia bacterium]
MTDCNCARELIPWYASGTLSSDETKGVTAHLAACESCREELAGTLRLKIEIEGEIRRLPRLSDATWKQVAAEALGQPVVRLDVGSFLLGFSLGSRVRGGKVPVRGDLSVMGRKIRLFNVEQEGSK